jgi:hypothetical protein
MSRERDGVLGWVPARLFGGCELTARNTLAEIGGVAVGGTVAVGCTATIGVATVGTGMALCGAAGSAIGGGVHDALDGDPNTNPFDLRRRGPEAALGGGSILAGRLASNVLQRSAPNTTSVARPRSTVASDGTEITGFTGHGIQRVIGDGGARAGVRPEALLDALSNPLRTTSGVDQLGRPFRIYTGANARVVVNPDTGRVVSVNPLSGAGAHR